MSEILQPLGQWDTALDKEGRLWASVDGEGWRCTGLSPKNSTWTPSRVAEHNLMRTPLGAELERRREENIRLREENHNYHLSIGASIRDADDECASEYVTRDELAEKFDEVYQAIRDAVAYGPEYGAAPERPMPERSPTPPEPTGLGATVRDVDGDYWVHVGEGSWQFGVPGGTERPWDGVTRYGPLTVVFEGVES